MTLLGEMLKKAQSEEGLVIGEEEAVLKFKEGTWLLIKKITRGEALQLIARQYSRLKGEKEEKEEEEKRFQLIVSLLEFLAYRGVEDIEDIIERIKYPHS
jgi:hypothetical protein